MPRPYNTSTRLGQRMADSGWNAGEFAVVAGVNPRVLTEYLAGRARISADHLHEMARVLGCEEWEIDG